MGAALRLHSRRGIFRSRFSPARWRRPWRPATAWWPSRRRQTPLMAAEAVRLLHEAGVPAEPCSSGARRRASPGRAWWPHPMTAGVPFTGSTRRRGRLDAIGRQRGPIVPLIAETGGMNAMIVDSRPARTGGGRCRRFGLPSAGQRCSALRLLCRARGRRRSRAVDAGRCHGRIVHRRSGLAVHRHRSGDRPGLVTPTGSPCHGDGQTCHPSPCRSRRRLVHWTRGGEHRKPRRPARRGVRADPACGALAGGPSRSGGRRYQRHRFRPTPWVSTAASATPSRRCGAGRASATSMSIAR